MATGKITNPNKTSLVTFDQYNKASYIANAIVTIVYARTGKQLTRDVQYLIGTLPEEARPSYEVIFETTCRNQYRLQLRVNSQGDVSVTPYQDIADIWMYTTFTFVI